MISLSKIILEGDFNYDADDYIPIEGLEPGMIVRDKSGEAFQILDFAGQDKLIVRLVDDYRDIRGMIYDQDCVAHASEQTTYDDVDDDDTLDENEDIDNKAVVAKIESFLKRPYFTHDEIKLFKEHMPEIVKAVEEDYSEPGFNDIRSMTLQDFYEILDSTGIKWFEDNFSLTEVDTNSEEDSLLEQVISDLRKLQFEECSIHDFENGDEQDLKDLETSITESDLAINAYEIVAAIRDGFAKDTEDFLDKLGLDLDRYYIDGSKADTFDYKAQISEVDGEAENLSPESIIYGGDEIIGKGEGFNVADIEEALRNSYNEQQDSLLGRDLSYAYLDIENTPAENGVSTLSFNETGKYSNRFYGEQKCLTIPEAAQQVEQKLKTRCNPKDLEQHIRGWIITKSKARPGLYPMLDEEGVKIYKAAEKKLSADIKSFYKGSSYWGD